MLVAYSTSPPGELWVRQIRRISLGDQTTRGEYASAIAVVLLRKASHHRDTSEQNTRRPYLLWLAACIAEHLKTVSISAL